MIGIFVLLMGVQTGPSAIHAYYRYKTPVSVITANRETYNRLAAEELSMDKEARQSNIRKRQKLFLWFHARGLNIDEDDEPCTVWHPWHELIEYWKLGVVE